MAEISNQQASSAGTDTLKCWSSSDKLTWSDFKGKADTGSMFTAVCPSTLTSYPDSTHEYRVKAVFYRYEAWSKTTSEHSLAHEQLHFDITELFARKLRVKIKEFKGAHDSTFAAMINGLLADLRVQQTVYDEETVHGVIKKSQQEWMKKINKELESLNEYASTSQDCQ
jgi:hypothetical protein